jgi:hypothetical protein
MVSTLIVVTVASLALALAWGVLRSGHPEICSRQDWEEKKHDIDLPIFRTLVDPDEECYIRGALSPRQFHSFQRRRMRLALRMLNMAEENAGMLMKLGELARLKGDPEVTLKADELIATAIQFRLNLYLLKLCLYLKWLYPLWNASLPTFEVRYQYLLDSLAQIQERGEHALT